MKKLLFFGVLLSIVLFSCNRSTKKDKVNASPSVVHKSLNGIDSTVAHGEISKFYTTYYKRVGLDKMDFWIGIDVINHIVQLLNDEKKIQKARHDKHLVDGVRIYFASNGKSGISLIFVTTVDSLSNPADPHSDTLHHDYYLHDGTESLFGDNTWGIIPTKYADRKNGERLFSGDFGTTDDGCMTDNNESSYLPTQDAYTMVNSFCVNNTAVNTVAVWYSTGIFENITNEGSGCDGIHIYFARHLPTDLNSNRDTFIMTTTEKDSTDSTNHKDYFYCKSEMIRNKHGFLEKTNVPYLNLPPGDNGSLCPNNCNTPTP